MIGAGKDLVVLLADQNAESAIRGILGRNQSLGIRPVSYDTFVHPERDPGCLRRAAEFLRSFSRQYDKALVIFDHDGCGREQVEAASLEVEVESSVATAGWPDRVAALVLKPELETWVWADSPHVAGVLGWVDQDTRLEEWLDRAGFPADSRGKPHPPKEAMERVLRHVRRPRSSALYFELANKVGLTRCQDAGFQKLHQRLQSWFPEQ